MSMSDIGVMVAAIIMNASAATVAGVETAAQIKIAMDQNELAEDYVTISEEVREHYESVFVSREDQEMEEAQAMFNKQVPLERGIASRMAASANHAFIGKGREAIKCLSRYSTGKAIDLMIDVEQLRVDAITQAQMAGAQSAFLKQQAEKDRGYARVIASLKRGHDMAADSFNISQVTASAYKALSFEGHLEFYTPRRTEQRERYDRTSVTATPTKKPDVWLDRQSGVMA